MITEGRRYFQSNRSRPRTIRQRRWVVGSRLRDPQPREERSVFEDLRSQIERIYSGDRYWPEPLVQRW